MKILHVTECVGGGVARAIDCIPGSMPSCEHFLLSVRPDVQTPSGRGFAGTAILPEGHIKRILAIRRTVSELRPDVIHAHSSWAGFYVRAMSLPGRIVYQPHGYALELGGWLRRIAFTAAEWMLAQRRSSVAVLSPHEFDIAGRLNGGVRRVFVPNVPTVSPRPGRAVSRSRRVVMVGRLGYQKDPEYFAALKQCVASQDGTIEFRWIGDGDVVRRRDLERAGVTVTGWLNDNDLVEELEAAGIYAHTGRYEGFPLSVLDAAACGLPVAARAIPAFDGLPVAQFESLFEHAQAIVEFFAGPGSDSDLAARNAELLKIMSPVEQEAALRRLYDPFAPADESFVIATGARL
ncbi:glycosyltransferase [Sinomonas sp. ASV322]|uniref:glycosyltransferase n=1 Tax=Sinomonas sp. ASV322 TaxID=3041920 RepID=UPI0027DE8C53|nr:glycosyltransferase [Sinomonas sp. ASV322]MDQ4502981.1 glycosyltransferase [Sinomonas sp. ASV322]